MTDREELRNHIVQQAVVRGHQSRQQPVIRDAIDELGIRRAHVTVGDGVAEPRDDAGIPALVALGTDDALRANGRPGLGQRQ